MNGTNPKPRRTSPISWIFNSPYRPVVTHPVLRYFFPGFALGSLGGGMSTVAVAWLTIELSPTDQEATWVSLAIAATVLPGAIGASTLGRWLNGRPGAQIASWDSWLRAAGFALIPAFHVLDILTVGLLISILAMSSILSAWGRAGRYSLLSEVLSADRRLAANSLMNVVLESTTIIGPLATALAIENTNTILAFALIASTFVLLAATYRITLAKQRDSQQPSKTSSKKWGLRALRENPTVLGLLIISTLFFFFYGPLTVALPVYVAATLGESASALAAFYTAFGIGAVAGALTAGHLERVPLWLATSLTITGFGMGLLPLAFGAPLFVSTATYAVCGLMWGPFPIFTTTLFQEHAGDHVNQVLAARGAIMGIAIPMGALTAGPIVSALGPQIIFLSTSLLLIALGTGVSWLRWRKRSGNVKESNTNK